MIEIAIQKKLNAASGIMHLDLDLQIESGQFLALYGKSGAGKTSVLRILAGLMKPDYGKIEVEGITWLDSRQKLFLKPSKRKVGMVFQDYALFPNMTVKQNLLYALGNKKDYAFVNELIEIVELGALQDRKPPKLSGGQQQRVALARALVQRPQLLLLDEPLSALDHEIRGKLQDHILRVHQEFGLTTILVSHNHAEVLKMADQVLMIEKGQITRQASPQEVFLSEQSLLKIEGVIEEIVPNVNGALLHLRVGNQVVKLQLDHSSSVPLKIGQKLAITSTLNGIQIKG